MVFPLRTAMLRHVRSVLSSARLLSASDSVVPSLALSTSAVSQAPAPPDNGWLPPEAEFYAHQIPAHDKYCRQRNKLPIGPRYPAIAQNAYIAPSAVVIGDVDILDSVSMFVIQIVIVSFKLSFWSCTAMWCVGRWSPSQPHVHTFFHQHLLPTLQDLLGVFNVSRCCCGVLLLQPVFPLWQV